jgi:hypothetical protein
VVKVLGFSVLVLLLSGVCLLCIRISSLIGRAGSVGISLAGPVLYISHVCLRLWSAGPVRVYSGTVVVWAAGLYGFSSFWLCSGGYSTVEMVRGGWSVFPFAFSSLLSVLLAVGYLW